MYHLHLQYGAMSIDDIAFERGVNILTIRPGDINDDRKDHPFALAQGEPYHDVWRYAGMQYDALVIEDADSISEFDLQYLMCRLRSDLKGYPRVYIEGVLYDSPSLLH